MNEIEGLCEQIVSEAQAIWKYTNRIDGEANNEALRNVYDSIRADEWEHLQALMVMLGERMKGGEDDGQA